MSQHVPTAGDQSRMGRTYVLVALCEAVVVVALWWFGRVYSR